MTLIAFRARILAQTLLNSVFAALVLTPYFGNSAHAQNNSLSGKPCIIEKRSDGRNDPETLKGTCYFDEKGTMSYWVAEWWDDITGERLKDYQGKLKKAIVGYPGALDAQKRYNDTIVNTLGGANFASPPYGDCRVGSDLDPPQYAACWKFPLLGNARPDELRMNVPRSIPQTGQLDEDTLRIPFFSSGVALLHAQEMFRLLCKGVDQNYATWLKTQPASTLADHAGAEVSFCDPAKDPPQSDKLERYQNLLQAIGEQLGDAQTAALRYDEIMMEYYFLRPVRPDIPPAGLADTLSTLETALEVHLGRAKELDREATTFESTMPEFFVSPPIR